MLAMLMSVDLEISTVTSICWRNVDLDECNDVDVDDLDMSKRDSFLSESEDEVTS
jgi:hypothetical protein